MHPTATEVSLLKDQRDAAHAEFLAAYRAHASAAMAHKNPESTRRIVAHSWWARRAKADPAFPAPPASHTDLTVDGAVVAYDKNDVAFRHKCFVAADSSGGGGGSRLRWTCVAVVSFMDRLVHTGPAT